VSISHIFDWVLPGPSQTINRVPLSTFLFKIAGSCNLDCDYCYVYHSPDDSWKHKPMLMPIEVVDQALVRIIEHVKANAVPSISLVLHGGEPLLAGFDMIEYIFQRATELTAGLCDLELSLQSNGILVSKDIVHLLDAYDARIGISIDGFREANLHRRLRNGQSSFEQVEAAISLLNADEAGRHVLSGFLSVVDVRSDPIAIYQYLAGYKPRSLDFLLPCATHDRYPDGKESFEDAPYGRWLIALFDYWFYQPEKQIRIKYFNNIITLLLGGRSETECLGHPPVNIVTIETNGGIEGVDTLKVAFDGAPSLNMNVFASTFDEVLSHPAILSRMQGRASLAAECHTCPLVDVCGGGYLPHRFSTQRGFNNPSVFCHDIAELVFHIRAELIKNSIAQE
jgi:uncharacterized protein